LLASLAGAPRYVVEAAGPEVADTLARLTGVSEHSSAEVDGRIRVVLDASGDEDLRPIIFGLAKDREWTLWELHRERASLEQVFRNLTARAEPAPDVGAGEERTQNGTGGDGTMASEVDA
jgi:hypothetical protein